MRMPTQDIAQKSATAPIHPNDKNRIYSSYALGHSILLSLQWCAVLPLQQGSDAAEQRVICHKSLELLPAAHLGHCLVVFTALGPVSRPDRTCSPIHWLRPQRCRYHLLSQSGPLLVSQCNKSIMLPGLLNLIFQERTRASCQQTVEDPKHRHTLGHRIDVLIIPHRCQRN